METQVMMNRIAVAPPKKSKCLFYAFPEENKVNLILFNNKEGYLVSRFE
jgi:hypothetical protein